MDALAKADIAARKADRHGDKNKFGSVRTTQWRFALYYFALVNGNRGTVSNERRARRLIECLSELFAVKSCDVCVEFEPGRIPNFPARMLDSIFAAAAAKRGVTPIMFGDKFGVASRWNYLRLASRTHF